MQEQIRLIYEKWLAGVQDEEVRQELLAMQEDEESIEDSFYKNLSFGTGGLRGVLGAGTNRMNIYTVAKASQGLADYVKKHYEAADRRIAVSYDSRRNSELFARTAVSVFAANGIETYVYSELMPTPCLSFAVRYLQCAVGVMITASHNPAKYNGYKVYGEDGCQITTTAAEEILREIEKLDVFEDIAKIEFEEAVGNAKIKYINEDVFNEFIEEVKKQSVLGEHTEIDKNVSIIYTPLNGTGLKPVLRVLKEAGYENVIVVKEQEQPDGSFPTCPYPNPEVEAAMKLGIEYARRYQADLLLATDPDCDRAGIAVKNTQGEYVLLSGNETGLLLFDYICARRIEMGTMPEHPVMIKTIVTTDMAEQIAAHYGVQTRNVLTGFKYIGEQITELEKNGEEDSFIFGFEESYGYLSGAYVRDKDAVNASFLICEMFAYYKSRGINLIQKLDELYHVYGYHVNTLHSYEFEGVEGFERMQHIMKKMREQRGSFAFKRIEACRDYIQGLDGLPKSDVLKFELQDNCAVVIRPSGTEPKLKVYLSICAENKKSVEAIENEIKQSIEKLIKCE